MNPALHLSCQDLEKSISQWLTEDFTQKHSDSPSAPSPWSFAFVPVMHSSC